MAVAAYMNHQNVIDRDYAGVPVPVLIEAHRAEYQRCDIVRNRRVNSKENHAASREWFPALDRDLAEIFVEGQQDSAVRFREVQQRSIARARMIRSRPHHIVSGPAQCCDCRKREVFIREQAHQTGSG